MRMSKICFANWRRIREVAKAYRKILPRLVERIEQSYIQYIDILGRGITTAITTPWYTFTNKWRCGIPPYWTPLIKRHIPQEKAGVKYLLKSLL